MKLFLTACIGVTILVIADALRIRPIPKCLKPTPLGCNKEKACALKRCFPGQKCKLACGTCNPICTGLCQPCQLAKCSVGYYCYADRVRCTAKCCKTPCSITACQTKKCPPGSLPRISNKCSCSCECSCLKPCNKILKRVCGTDGKTYGNDCLLENAACKNSQIKKKHDGPCRISLSGCPVMNPCDGIRCGPGRRCEPNMNDCSYTCSSMICPAIICKASVCDTRKNLCEPGQNCIGQCGGCMYSCSISRCNRFCPEIYKPVCGTDGKTYDNDCELSIVTCKSGGKIRKKKDGKCCPRFCTLEHNPVCGSDGKTYSNRCFLNIAICESNGKIKPAPCQPRKG